MKNTFLFFLIYLTSISCFSQNWNSINSNTSEDLNCIYFNDSMKGWIASANGLFMKSINGGNDWETIDLGATQRLTGIYFLDEYNGWLVMIL